MNSDSEENKIEVGPVKPRSRGIYLLPNLLTTAGLFAGFYAIVSAINNQYEAAAVAIFIAMVLDGLDGRIARLTHTQSDFGAEYDSLVDMVAFGLAPALVVYLWCLQSLGKVGWLVAFVYVACAALRLARFNSQNGSSEKRFFKGLASPSAAALVAGFIWVGTDWIGADTASEPGRFITVVGLVVTLFAALLMVSNVLFRSFKDFDMKGRVPFVALLIVVMVFVLISIDPPIVLFAGFLIYALSGPVGALMRRSSKRSEETGEE
ncbi:MAG: CDP-diacylglycerol--serine O-phosphatidyltransferase [Gammaproteobacteria bacterium]|nr:MAG: CDP-diacylglycerol--serine O-phosphatidyltransferase [Gammaproteobacteria bacterium]